MIPIRQSFWFGAAAFVLGLSACQKENLNNRQAPRLIQDSFVSATFKSLEPYGFQLGIDKESLDKEFLLQSSMMNQIPIAMSSGLKSRIVIFKEFQDQLFMLEASDGHRISDDFPQNIILASFPIRKRTDSHIYFDFNAGMSKLFVSDDWNSVGKDGPYTDTFSTIDVNLSFIDELDYKDNRAIIRQIVSVDQRGQARSIEVKYYFEPYQRNENFKPTDPTDMKKMGFFTTAGRYENGLAKGYATKFDHTKDIVFGISANTPEEYRQAVEDGILYWNKAFPGNPIKARIAPEGVTAPDYDLNMVQWVNWDAAGFAYADAQSDPRTGEIKHAQVFMTSVFAVSGREKAKRLLATLEENKKVPVIGIKGMMAKQLCDHDMFKSYKAHLLAMTVKDLSDNQILEISRDYVREVVAHEIGHTLGLRHNFAGSLYQNYNPEHRNELFRNYLSTGVVPHGVTPSSSVMEYQPFEEATMSGEIIETGVSALDYDLKAIQSLYLGREFSIEELPPFCSDGRGYLDCQTFDFGRNPIESLSYNRINLVDALASALVNEFIMAKSNGNDVILNSDRWAYRAFSGLSAAPSLFSNKLRLLQVRRAFDSINEYNLDDVIGLERDLLAQALTENSLSIIDLLPNSTNFPLEEVYLNFARKLEIIDILTESEKGLAKDMTLQLFSVLPEKLTFQELELLSNIGDLPESPWSTQLQDHISQRALQIILATDGKTQGFMLKEGVQVEIELPKFVYSFETRQAAIEVLTKNRNFRPWYVEGQKVSLKDALQKLETETLGSSEPLDYRTVDDSVAQWYSELRKLLASLY